MQKLEPVGVVLAHEDVLDTIMLDDRYTFKALLDVGLDQIGCFYLRIEIDYLDEKAFRQLEELDEVPRPMAISSPFLQKEGFDIAHIVIFNSCWKENTGVVWECLSEEP